MKDEIMKIAEDQLLRGGYARLNFGSIAKMLETTRANLHYHFGNKETLAIEVVRDFSLRQIAGLKALHQAYRHDFHSFMAALDASFWPQDQSGDQALNTCTMLALDTDLPEEVRDMSYKFYRQAEEIIFAAVSEAVADGEVRQDIDPKRETVRVHVMMMGLMTSIQHVPDKDAAKSQMSGLLVEWAEGLR
ncbi:MAG: TetR/AcrR family transcriptional regulator [Pseudomonadota bacterium]